MSLVTLLLATESFMNCVLIFPVIELWEHFNVTFACFEKRNQALSSVTCSFLLFKLYIPYSNVSNRSILRRPEI